MHMSEGSFSYITVHIHYRTQSQLKIKGGTGGGIPKDNFICTKTYIVLTHQNHLAGMTQMSNHSAFFYAKNNLTVNILKFCTPKFIINWHMQTMQTQIRLLLKEHSDQDQHSTLFAISLSTLGINYFKSKILVPKV